MKQNRKNEPWAKTVATTATVATNEVPNVANVAGQMSITTKSEDDPRTQPLATTATLATNPPLSADVATLLSLCADFEVSPADARARVSVAELAELAAGGAPEETMARFSKAVGKARARGKP